MPRKPRLEAEGLLYHVIARGIERRDIFKENEDYRFYLARLGEILAATQIDCYAFCLMPNHFHLLLKQNSIPLSTAMRRLLTRYAIYFNKRYKRSGHLFQNRYKSIICQEEAYLLELVRYIHLNPVRANIVQSIDELAAHPHSGHAALVGKSTYDWFPKERVLSHFGAKDVKSATRAYLDFMADGLAMGKDVRYSGGGLKRSLGYPERYPKERQAYDERILGDGNFVLTLQLQEEGSAPLPPDMTIDELVERVARACFFDPERIISSSKAKEVCRARALIAHIAATRLGCSFAEIARYLGVNRSSAARMAERGASVLTPTEINTLFVKK